MLATAGKKATSEIEKILDLGFVGLPSKINTDFLKWCIKTDFIPVISPIGYGDKFETYNINADIVAGAIAQALNAEKLILLTNTPGILDADQATLSSLNKADVEALIADGTISEGMLPKVECALNAVSSGVNSATIVDGRVPHALLLEVFTDSGVGTQILSAQSDHA